MSGVASLPSPLSLNKAGLALIGLSHLPRTVCPLAHGALPALLAVQPRPPSGGAASPASHALAVTVPPSGAPVSPASPLRPPSTGRRSVHGGLAGLEGSCGSTSTSSSGAPVSPVSLGVTAESRGALPPPEGRSRRPCLARAARRRPLAGRPRRPCSRPDERVHLESRRPFGLARRNGHHPQKLLDCKHGAAG